MGLFGKAKETAGEWIGFGTAKTARSQGSGTRFTAGSRLQPDFCAVCQIVMGMSHRQKRNLFCAVNKVLCSL